MSGLGLRMYGLCGHVGPVMSLTQPRGALGAHFRSEFSPQVPKMSGLGLIVEGVGLRDSGFGFRASVFGFQNWYLGFEVPGLGFGAEG